MRCARGRVLLRRQRAREERGSATPSGAQSRSIVRKCCSASVSVGAMSAPWRPLSTARRSAYSATTVLPEPTSPWSRRCIGTVAVEVGVDLGDRPLLAAVSANGSASRYRATSSPGAPSAAPGALALAAAGAASPT